MSRHVLLLLAATLLAAGCRNSATTILPASSPPSANGVAMSEVKPGFARDPGNRQYRLLVRLRLASIEVPVGTASGSEEIWSYLDEERVRSGGLGRNGIRVGVGRAESWPDISRVLSKLTGRPVQESAMLGVPGSTTQIVLREGLDSQTIFIVHPDRTVSGCDYPPGDCVLALACTLNENEPSEVMLTLMPQVRGSHLEPQIIQQDGGPLMVSRAPVFPMPDMTFQTSVNSKDFMVIGPGAESRRPYTAGHQFLVKSKDGMDFETVLVLMPEVFAAPPARPSPNPTGG